MQCIIINGCNHTADYNYNTFSDVQEVFVGYRDILAASVPSTLTFPFMGLKYGPKKLELSWKITTTDTKLITYYVGLCSFVSVFTRKYFLWFRFFLNSLEIIMALVEIIC